MSSWNPELNQRLLKYNNVYLYFPIKKKHQNEKFIIVTKSKKIVPTQYSFL